MQNFESFSPILLHNSNKNFIFALRNQNIRIMNKQEKINKLHIVHKMMVDRSKAYVGLLSLMKGNNLDRRSNIKTNEEVIDTLDTALDNDYSTENILSVFPWYKEDAEGVTVTDEMLDRLIFILSQWNRYVKCEEYTNPKQRQQFYDYKKAAIRTLYKNGERIVSEEMHTREDENGRTEFFASYTVQTSDGTLYRFHQPWKKVYKLYLDQRHYYAMLKDVRPYVHSEFDTESITGSEEERKTFKKMLAELYILLGVIRKNLPKTYKQFSIHKKGEKMLHYEEPFTRFIKILPLEEATPENFETINAKLTHRPYIPSIKIYS